MTENNDKSTLLTQKWLTEIKSLKQQMAQLQSERDQAWESEQKWRQLYNTEAEQRRTDAQLSQQAIASLKAQLQKFPGIDNSNLPETTTDTDIEQEISQLTTIEAMRAKVIAIIKERASLIQSLKMEQDNHAQTRKSLTSALGDAIDSLARERALSKDRATSEEESSE